MNAVARKAIQSVAALGISALMIYPIPIERVLAAPSASECSAIATYLNQSGTITTNTANAANADLNNGDIPASLVDAVLGRHDLASLSVPKSAQKYRSDMLATLDEMTYQTALALSGGTPNFDQEGVMLAKATANVQALAASCGVSATN